MRVDDRLPSHRGYDAQQQMCNVHMAVDNRLRFSVFCFCFCFVSEFVLLFYNQFGDPYTPEKGRKTKPSQRPRPPKLDKADFTGPRTI